MSDATRDAMYEDQRQRFIDAIRWCHADDKANAAAILDAICGHITINMQSVIEITRKFNEASAKGMSPGLGAPEAGR